MDQSTAKRKRGVDKPSVDEFHKILTLLAPSASFSKAAVEVLRELYFCYLRRVASSLVEHDKIAANDEAIVVDACSLGSNPEFLVWTKEAMTLVKEAKSDPNTAPKAKRSKTQITAEMEEEQERLLAKSKNAMEKTQGAR